MTLAAGDDPVTCSITNDDQPIELIIEKVVVNDDGGTAVVDDFGITTSAGTLVFGAAVEAPADTFTYTAATLEVAPGTYTLAELALAGYEPTAWTCTNGDGGAFDAGSVTLAAGDEPVTCSITNDDFAPTLTLLKTVIGGTATEDDFQPQIDGVPVEWGVANAVTAGDHVASEIVDVPGYVAYAWGGDCAPDGSVTLGPADDLTCTIVNAFISLEVDKVADESPHPARGSGRDLHVHRDEHVRGAGRDHLAGGRRLRPALGRRRLPGRHDPPGRQLVHVRGDLLRRERRRPERRSRAGIPAACEHHDGMRDPACRGPGPGCGPWRRSRHRRAATTTQRPSNSSPALAPCRIPAGAVHRAHHRWAIRRSRRWRCSSRS